jgi:hypothetical protein
MRRRQRELPASSFCEGIHAGFDIASDPAALVAKFTVAFAIGQIPGPVWVSLLPQGATTLDSLLCVSALLLVGSGMNLLRIRGAKPPSW